MIPKRRGWNAGAALLVALAVLGALQAGAGAAPGAPNRKLVAAIWPFSDAAPKARQLPAAPPENCYAIPRSIIDRPDIRDGRLVHVIYMTGTNGPDEGLDTDGTIDCSIRAQNEWFEEQSGGLSWRFDTFMTKVVDPKTGKKMKFEAVDVTFVKVAVESSRLDDAGAVSAELIGRGFNLENKRYLTYVAGGSENAPCGDAYYPLDQSGESDGQYAQIYMFGPQGCHGHEFGAPGSPSWVEMIAQQEIIHNDAVVPLGAPHGCGPLGIPAHVCTGPLWATEGAGNLDPERFDVMFPFVSEPLSEKRLDIGHDDYFGHLLPIRDLADSFYLERL